MVTVEFDLPPVPPVAAGAPLTPAVRQAVEDYYRGLAPDQIETACRLLQGMTWRDPVPPEIWRAKRSSHDVRRFLAHPELNLIQAVRFIFLTESLGRKEWHGGYVLALLGGHYFTHTPRFTLRELGAVFVALGLLETNIGHMFLARGWFGLPFEWEPDGVWPFFAERPESLEKALDAKDKWAESRRLNALEILALFPRIPARLEPRVWDIALLGTKKDRPAAQAILDRHPDRDEKLLAFLASPKAEIRAATAEWLGRTGSPAALSALKAALDKEKQDRAAGAMMAALERLGVQPSEITDLGKLLTEARKGLGKGIPAGLSWLGFETLPEVRWQESGEPVDRDLLHWLVLQSHEAGNPEPGPRLRFLASLFRTEDAEELGQHILEIWIGHDTLPHTPEEAEAYAKPVASQAYQMSRRYPEHYPEQLSEEEYFQRFYSARLAEPRGSAIKEKGVLAVAGACCGARAAAPVRRYLDRYYGTRAAHCKALLQMLAWVDQPAAIQVLLAVAARFRTAGIRQEAERLVVALAERKGWTLDQLADRTIPTGGFDERSELVLDYGGRTFTAKLGEEWSIVLTNQEGKTVKALPDARQGEDEEKVKEAKKTLSAAKKEIQTILRQQKDRLYEALCTQRSWTLADWEEFLHRHPIVGRYCQRLIWSLWDGDTLTATFRPLEDGSLTDPHDEAVTPPPEATVRLAHSSLLPEETAEAWRRHIVDYQVRPLFEQLGKPWKLPEELRQAEEIAEFQGHRVEAFKLRSRATKLGYTRGPAEDGAIFTTYEKTLPGLGLTVLLEFSGNSLPEENRNVALIGLSFANAAERVPLGQVPPVLLSEGWNDLASIAALGTGYDPDWEKDVL